MTLLDTNLLIYAFRPEFHQHEAAREWLDDLLAHQERIILHPLAAGAFVRLTTRQLGPVPPAPANAAIGFLSSLEHASGGSSLAESSSHFSVLARLCAKHHIKGDAMIDAWLAAFAITHDLTLASHDDGFQRFMPELDWLDPLHL